MENKSFEIQVLERLTAIETTLKQQDYKAVNEKLNQTEFRSINNENRLNKIEDNNRWLWRTVGASIVTMLLGICATFIRFK